ncbi:hypothetical protein EGW08_015522 [Elysia chlorotica]|uniref:Uncharacterized protein n=1 Tax=Elysia chlorotica TaxID=188477 RepID=A0A433T548_ELYCH|nr:hypothetical protein EGW08_015522 [Elysia chlorotica]
MTVPDSKSAGANKTLSTADLDLYMTSEHKQKELEAMANGLSRTDGKDHCDGTQADTGRYASWRTACLHFAQITTLHGVRFVFLDSAFLVRRLLWLALFVICSTLMGIQIIERIVHYYGYPVTVNVNVNFNKTLAFPALTVCNQNAFRATATTERDLYHFIERVYNRSSSTSPASGSRDEARIRYSTAFPDLARPDIRDLTLDDLFRSAAHRKEDLIVGCEWEDEPCGPENFTESLTDHGVCYTFNAEPGHQKWVTSAGSEYGIKLTLNVEQYEYMPGPHNAAGIKILLHNKKEFPKVAELGLAVSPGMHAYLGMQLLWIENLPEPHGTCRSQDSPYYSHYSPEACQLACMSQRLEQICGCRHMYMPHVDDFPPICTMERYLTCYHSNIGKVKDYVRDNCDCPVPCNFLIYDPTISFASTSVYATDQLLASTTTRDIKRRFLYARETTERMNHLKFNHFLKLEKDMRNSFERLKQVMTHDVKERIEAQRKSLEAIFENLKEIKDRKRHLLEWQAYHVNKNFMRARNAMEERTMLYLMMGFQEYSYQVEARIYQMATNGTNGLDQDVRTSIYYDLMNLINGRVDLADRAFANYTQLYGAYYNGSAIFRYKFKKELRADNHYITPRPLLRDCLFRTAYTRKYSSRVGKDILEIKKFLLQYSSLANTNFVNGTVDRDMVHLTNVNRGRQFYQRLGKPVINYHTNYQSIIEHPPTHPINQSTSKPSRTNVLFLNRGWRFCPDLEKPSRSEFYEESVEYPLRVLEGRLAELDRRWRLFQEECDRMLTTASHTLDELSHLEQTILSR